MTAILLPMLVALMGGIAAALQGPFAGMMGRSLGDLEGVFITYCGGAVAISIVIWIIQGDVNFEAWRRLPWYVFLAGPLGLIIVGSYSFSIPRLGAATSTIVFVASSLTLGVILDHFGLLGVGQRTLDISRVIGVTIFLLGIWLVK